MLAAMVLAGCSAQAFQQLAVEVPGTFKEVSASGKWKPPEPAEAQARGTWCKAFNDAALDALIDEATAANQDLAAAAARVRQAGAVAGLTEASRMPQVGWRRCPAWRRIECVVRSAAGSPVASGSLFQASLNTRYEVDLFGRVLSNVSAAHVDAQGSAATFRSVLLALQAEVAQTYFWLRTADAELDLLKETVRLREENVRFNGRRSALDNIGELDLVRAKTELGTT